MRYTIFIRTDCDLKTLDYNIDYGFRCDKSNDEYHFEFHTDDYYMAEKLAEYFSKAAYIDIWDNEIKNDWPTIWSNY